jgi:hydroxymethylglutaryl-CoA reductase
MMNQGQGFYKLPWAERLALTAKNRDLNAEQVALIEQHYDAVGAQLIENYLYNFGVPTGLLLDLPVDGELAVVPMSTEEPSVIAAANNGAKMMRAGEGVTTTMETRLVRGQIIITDVTDMDELRAWIVAHESELMTQINATRPSMVRRGGGLKKLALQELADDIAEVTLFVDPKAAMGANVVNSLAEYTSSIFRAQGYNVLMGILSNYATESIVHGEVKIPVSALVAKDGTPGATIAAKIEQASRIEQLTPYRAVTSNKGIMNGVEAVALASGNDTRAINAALHAYASRDGQYRGLINWTVEQDMLVGKTDLPILIGVVGGSIGIVPAVQLNHVLMGNPTVERLSSLLAGVALAQNLAALRALVSTGIQAGHMALQGKSLALQVGATPEEVPAVALALEQQGRFDELTAREILETLRQS